MVAVVVVAIVVARSRAMKRSDAGERKPRWRKRDWGSKIAVGGGDEGDVVGTSE